MKKLLFALFIIILTFFFFVGCVPTTPTEGEEEGESELSICPTVEITSQTAIGEKTYIKAGKQTITVTFAVSTEPVSVFVGGAIKGNLEGVPDNAVEVVMYPDLDKKVYTGTFTFFGDDAEDSDCSEDYIYVFTCNTCAPCKYPYIVDSVAPYATVEICIDTCTCAGCELSFTSTTSEVTCDDDTVNCGDACSEIASWSIDIYDDYPFNDCCLIPCETPIASDSGVCPIDFTTTCLGTSPSETLYVVVTLVDQVGNETKMGATVVFNPDACDAVTLNQWPDGDCVDTPDFVLCKGIVSALGNISGTVKNALNGNGIAGATVTMLNTSIPPTTTDSSGNYSFSDVPIGTYNLKGSATGYNDGIVSVIVLEGQTVNVDIVLTPPVPSGQMRIVLTWETLDDLDSHLWNPGGEHLYYLNKSITGANLDIDDVNGFGPETITITALSNGTYTYAVHAFTLGRAVISSSIFSESGAVVNLYDSTGLLNTFPIPSGSGLNRWWEVFTLSVSGGSVTVNPINTFSSSSPL